MSTALKLKKGRGCAFPWWWTLLYWTITLQMLLEEESFSINVLSLKGGVRDSLGHTVQAIRGLRRPSDCESHPETESLMSVLQVKRRTKTGLKHPQGFPLKWGNCLSLYQTVPKPTKAWLLSNDGKGSRWLRSTRQPLGQMEALSPAHAQPWLPRHHSWSRELAEQEDLLKQPLKAFNMYDKSTAQTQFCLNFVNSIRQGDTPLVEWAVKGIWIQEHYIYETNVTGRLLKTLFINTKNCLPSSHQ